VIYGDPSHFEKAHFEAHKGFAPAELCELVVYCLELVSQLSASGLEYRFKGGNSQLILLEQPRRFSIDVDIVSSQTKESLIACVESIAASCEKFKRCEVRPHKTKPWLPMISFKIFFDSVYGSSEEPNVMLDAVLEPAPYPGVRRPVRCGSLYASEQEVELPDIGGLIADKLLCIGPATMGIPMGKGKDAQRLKHVFDVATLSRHEYDDSIMRAALDACMAQENELQRSAHDFDAVVADTRAFVRAPLEFDAAPPADQFEESAYMFEIARGFPEFRKFLFAEDYDWGRFVADCRAIDELLDRVAG
jgi:hypothetical protein